MRTLLLSVGPSYALVPAQDTSVPLLADSVTDLLSEDLKPLMSEVVGFQNPPGFVRLPTAPWDLLLDSSGNIALADRPYALAQDVASAIRTFLGECYYDTTLGVPYFTQILGHAPPLTLLKARLVAAALTVPGVVSAICTISAFAGRTVTGQVSFIDDGGLAQSVNLGKLSAAGAIPLPPLPAPPPPPPAAAWTADSSGTVDSTRTP